MRKNVDRYKLTHNEKVYIIHLGRSKCSCRKWLKYKVCKHLLAADRIFSAKLVKDQFINKPKRGRTPNALEITSAVEFLTPPPDAPPEIAAANLNLLCQTLLCSNGFLYVE